MNIKEILRATPALIWTTTATTLILLPGHLLPTTSADHYLSSLLHCHNVDKLVHLALFAGYGLLWTLARPNRVIHVYTIGITAAVATELVQAIPVLRRTPDVSDAAADVIGLTLGVCLVAAALRRARGANSLNDVLQRVSTGPRTAGTWRRDAASIRRSSGLHPRRQIAPSTRPPAPPGEPRPVASRMTPH
jgi:VanZ like family